MGTVFEMYDSGINPDKLSAHRRRAHVQVRQARHGPVQAECARLARATEDEGDCANVDENGNRVVPRPTTNAESM